MKKLTRNQFSLFIAVATAKRGVTTGEASKRAGVVWHSGRVGLQSLVKKGFVTRDPATKLYTSCRIEDLGAVLFVHKVDTDVANKAVKEVETRDAEAA